MSLFHFSADGWDRDANGAFGFRSPPPLSFPLLPAIPYDIDLNLLDTFELPAADVNSLIREVRPFHPSNLPSLHTPPSSHIHTPQISCDSTRTERNPVWVGNLLLVMAVAWLGL
jgi:hypothetical protein